MRRALLRGPADIARTVTRRELARDARLVAGVLTAPRVAEKSADAIVDSAKIWEQVCAKIPAQGFLRTLVDSLAVIGTEGRHFVVGYPPKEKSAIETLATASNRKQLEELLKQTSGRDWSLKLSAKEGLPQKKAAVKADDYKDDPLIQEALQMFKGQIKP